MVGHADRLAACSPGRSAGRSAARSERSLPSPANDAAPPPACPRGGAEAALVGRAGSAAGADLPAHNVAHEVGGGLFGVSADTREDLFHELVPILRACGPAQRFEAQKRWQRGAPTWTPEAVDRVLIDTFDPPLPRPTGAARRRGVYWGKQKRHPLQTQVATEVQGAGLAIDAGHPGPTAAKRLYERSAVPEHCPNAVQQGALASVGTAGAEVPQRNTRGGQLTAAPPA